MKKELIPLIFWFFFAVGAHSQSSEEPLEFSLQQAKEYALENSYDTRLAKMDVEKARKRVQETTAIGLPQISGSGQFQNFLDIPTQVIPNFINDALPQPDPTAPEFIEAQFGTDYNISAGISASQLLFDGSYIVGLQAAKAYKELAANQSVKSQQEIQDEIVNAYAMVLIAEANKEVLTKNKKNIDSLLYETRELYNEGFTDEESVDQLDLLASELQNQVNNAQRQITLARNMLKFRMGLEISKAITLTDSIDFFIEQNSTSSNLLAQPLDLNTHIDYKLALNNEALQMLNMRNEKAGYLPSLSAFYNYEQTYLNNNLELESDFWFPTNVWGVQLNVPIFTSLKRTFKVQQAQINYEQAQLNTQQAEQGLQLEVLRAKADYNQAVDNFKTAEKNFALANKILNKETIKYQEGVSSSMDFTQAQNQLLQEQGNYLLAILNLVEKRTALNNALNNY